jgi:hypothetical protein
VFNFSIPQGAKGDTGDQGPQGEQGIQGVQGETGPAGSNAYVHIKWGTSATPATLLDTPNEYIGIASTSSATAPADYTGYSWYQWKGLKGDTGETGLTGETGATGATGNGIASITRTSGNGAPGTTDTYTITFTDATTATFTVYNGADGEGSGDMLKATYDPTNINASAFNVDNHVSGTTNKVYTATEQTKLSGIEAGANNYTHPATHSADIIVDGTTNKAYTATEKSKLAGIAAGAEVNVNADWNAVSGDAQILNKPTIPDHLSDLTDDATHRLVTDTEKSTWNGKAAVGSTSPSTQAFGDSASVGISGEAARADHKHAMPANPTPSTVSQADAEAGTSTTVYAWTPERVRQAISALGGETYYEKLLSSTVGTDAASISLDLSGIDTSDYVAIEVQATIFTASATTVNCTINNITSGYYGSYIKSASTSVTSVNNAANFGAFKTGVTNATGAAPAAIKLEIEYSRPYPVTVTYNRRYIIVEFSGGQPGSSASKIGSISVQDGTSPSSALSSIQFAAASGNILTGSEFYVYGVKK